MDARTSCNGTRSLSATKLLRNFPLLFLLLLPASVALAAEPPKLDSGNTAWMLTSSALVLFMTLPGLALFYGIGVLVQNRVTKTAAPLHERTAA